MGTAKFWGSKNENIAFSSNRLVPIFSFTSKELIYAVSDLLGLFFQRQNWFTKIGGLWLSATVVQNVPKMAAAAATVLRGCDVSEKDKTFGHFILNNNAIVLAE